MSYTLNIFTRDITLERVIQTLMTAPFNLALARRSAHTWEVQVLGLFVYVTDEYDLLDDRGIPFSEYSIEISIVRYAGASSEHRVALCDEVAHVVAEHFGETLNLPTMLVFDVQQLLQRWPA